VNRLQFAAFDPLHDGLPRDTENLGGVDHWHKAIDFFVNKTRSKILCKPNSPGCPRRQLFAGDESFGQPTMHRGWCPAEKLSRFSIVAKPPLVVADA
jgi:hypothetical protein